MDDVVTGVVVVCVSETAGCVVVETDAIDGRVTRVTIVVVVVVVCPEMIGRVGLVGIVEVTVVVEVDV